MIHMDEEQMELFDNLKWSCARGEIATRDAAKRLGMSTSSFYKRLRKDSECYELYRKNIDIRKPPETPPPCRASGDRDYCERKHYVEVMSGYRAKSKIVDRLAEARSLGMSYGQYVAYAEGFGRI